jgi:hypothetical protein
MFKLIKMYHEYRLRKYCVRMVLKNKNIHCIDCAAHELYIFIKDINEQKVK